MCHGHAPPLSRCCASSVPSPTQPGFTRVANFRAQIGQAQSAMGEGQGGGSPELMRKFLPPSPTLPHKGGGSAQCRWLGIRSKICSPHPGRAHRERRGGGAVLDAELVVDLLEVLVHGA